MSDAMDIGAMPLLRVEPGVVVLLSCGVVSTVCVCGVDGGGVVYVMVLCGGGVCAVVCTVVCGVCTLCVACARRVRCV